MDETHNSLPDRDLWSPTEVMDHFGPDAVNVLARSGIAPQLRMAFARDQVRMYAVQHTERYAANPQSCPISDVRRNSM